VANGQYPANGDQGPTYSFAKRKPERTKNASAFAQGWAIKIKGSVGYR
jgi:hypothetical protein